MMRYLKAYLFYLTMISPFLSYLRSHINVSILKDIFHCYVQELIVMESCHSFIHDMLKHMGPTNAMDPRLQEEINNFPPEAKVCLK